MSDTKKNDGVMAGLWTGYDSSYVSTPKDMDEKWVELLKKPRVIKASEYPASDPEALAAGHFKARQVNTSATGLATLVTFFTDFPAHSSGPNHGHINPAVFYVLEGKGHDLHDGKVYPWEAGDVVVVPETCVHRQVNDGDEPAIAVVINPKPAYAFLNLRIQRLVDRPGEGPTE